MAVHSASLLSFLPAVVEPPNPTRADSPAPTSCRASSLPHPLAGSIAQVRAKPNDAAPANSRSLWHRSATTPSLAMGWSSRSIATAVGVASCGSIPIVTDMEVLPLDARERHDGHSH